MMTRIYLLALCSSLLFPASVIAFPPYRTTDANTADPYTLELRLGLLKLDRKEGDTDILVPLLRANYGLPNKIELISEFEYSPEDNEMGDGALGIKWIPAFGKTFSFGFETLALLPVRPFDENLGVESQVVATYWQNDFRIHANAGGFYDRRQPQTNKGWRSSLLAEFLRGKYRYGGEFFVKDAGKEPIDARAGIGVIYNFGIFDIRTAVHTGITRAAPDISINLWISTEIPL